MHRKTGRATRFFSHAQSQELNRLARQEGLSIMTLAERFDCDKTLVERGLKFYRNVTKNQYLSDHFKRKNPNCASP